MGYWQRKYWLKYVLPDGNIWDGFINIEADNKSDLPETVKGGFWVEKKLDGWHGKFYFDNCEPYDKRTETSEVLLPWVITTGVHRPQPQTGIIPQSTEEADRILEYLKPVEYKSISRFNARLEDCCFALETHYWG